MWASPVTDKRCRKTAWCGFESTHVLEAHEVRCRRSKGCLRSFRTISDYNRFCQLGHLFIAIAMSQLSGGVAENLTHSVQVLRAENLMSSHITHPVNLMNTFALRWWIHREVIDLVR